MKIISWNTRGLTIKSKQIALKRFLINQHPDIVFIQETKKEMVDGFLIKAIWSSKDVGWVFVDSLGKYGGLLIMWDESKVTLMESLKGGYSLSQSY